MPFWILGTFECLTPQSQYCISSNSCLTQLWVRGGGQIIAIFEVSFRPWWPQCTNCLPFGCWSFPQHLLNIQSQRHFLLFRRDNENWNWWKCDGCNLWSSSHGIFASVSLWSAYFLHSPTFEKWEGSNAKASHQLHTPHRPLPQSGLASIFSSSTKKTFQPQELSSTLKPGSKEHHKSDIFWVRCWTEWLKT